MGCKISPGKLHEKGRSRDRLFLLLLPIHQGGQHDLSGLAIQLPLGYSSKVLGIVGIALPAPFLGYLMPSAFVFIRCAIIHVGIEAIRIPQCTHNLIEVCTLGQIQFKEPRPGLGVHHGLFHYRFLSREYILPDDWDVSSTYAITLVLKCNYI